MGKKEFELIRPADLASLKPEKDTHYVFSDDFLIPIDNVTENENRIAKKYLTLLSINLEDSDEIMFSINPIELYNLIILQRDSFRG